MKNNSITKQIVALATAAFLTLTAVSSTNAQNNEALNHIRLGAEQIAQLGLPYVFGGSHPSDGGMDCSGCLMHLLSNVGITNIPRTSYHQYEWLLANNSMKHTNKIPSGSKANGLKPGDLIFWGGTYESGHKVSHVMLYLGQGADGTHYMFGARGTDESVKGVNGAGVDIHVLNAGFQKNLIGYGTLPGLG